MSDSKFPFALPSSLVRLSLALTLSLAISCASAPAPSPVTAPAFEPAVEKSARATLAIVEEQAGRHTLVPNPVEVSQLLDAYARGPYFGEVEAVYAKARGILAQKAGSAERNAADKVAVVLDIDETSLSNLGFYRRNGYVGLEKGPCDLEKGPCSVEEWFSKPHGVAIAPALEFVRQARASQVTVFFVTGRREKSRAATEENLRTAGFEWQRLILKPDDFPRGGSAADFKAPARKKLEEEGYRILVNIGDQESDLNGGSAENTLKLPNPFYYIP